MVGSELKSPVAPQSPAAAVQHALGSGECAHASRKGHSIRECFHCFQHVFAIASQIDLIWGVLSTLIRLDLDLCGIFMNTYLYEHECNII